MSQHHLHSKEARNFNTKHLAAMSDEEVETFFAELRWGSRTEQACPECGAFRRHYRREHRKQWRCAECGREFSVTSGTLWHKRKKSLREILLALMRFESDAKSVSILEFSRLMGMTPKAAQVVLGKIRESMIRGCGLNKLKGVVHMDTAYFGGKPRKSNRHRKPTKEQLDVRHEKKQPADPMRPWVSAGMTQSNWVKMKRNKRAVMVLCELEGVGKGSRRCMPFVCFNENNKDAVGLASQYVDSKAIVMTDESHSLANLAAHFDHRTVRHSREYCTKDGVSDNMAETFFSRARRAEYGVWHGMRPIYLQDYMFEIAWRENNRRMSQRDRVCDLLGLTLRQPPSDWWRGYFQGHHRGRELGIKDFLDRPEGERSKPLGFDRGAISKPSFSPRHASNPPT